MKILGHRGARHEVPENTLLGVETAIAAGASAVEIDVRLTADGRLAVIHDETVDRTTNGQGPVVEFSLKALQTLDAGEGEQVPSLEQLLERVGERLERVFVELKAPGCEAEVVRVLAAAPNGARCTVISFEHEWLGALHRLAPQVPLGCLVREQPDDPVAVVRAVGATMLSTHLSRVDAALVATCHAAGIEVTAWNCNDPAEVARYRELGIDWLGTDTPTQVCPAAERGPA